MCGSAYDEYGDRGELVSTWAGDNTGLPAQQTVLKRRCACLILIVETSTDLVFFLTQSQAAAKFARYTERLTAHHAPHSLSPQ
jgi:hypothetical protein